MCTICTLLRWSGFNCSYDKFWYRWTPGCTVWCDWRYHCRCRSGLYKHTTLLHLLCAPVSVQLVTQSVTTQHHGNMPAMSHVYLMLYRCRIINLITVTIYNLRLQQLQYTTNSYNILPVLHGVHAVLVDTSSYRYTYK